MAMFVRHFLYPYFAGFFVITKGVFMQKVSYMGDGSKTEFTFNFPYFENTNIIVTKNNVITTGYNIIGTSGGQDADIPYIGGKVVFETAPTVLDNITIMRNLPLVRIVDYQPTSKIESTVLNQDINYIIEILKDKQDELDSLRSEYADIANKESTQTLLARIAALGQQITELGDISTLRQSVTTNAENITTLNTRTNGLLDYVIETQIPTAENNYAWYRKYKSGWIEQGGRITNGTTWNGGSLLVTAFTNSNYNIQATVSRNNFGDNTDSFNYFVSVEPVDNVAFCWATIGYGGTQNFRAFQWRACGY